MAADRLDMHALAETGGKVGAIEADAGKLDPVRFDFDGGFWKLYICLRGCQLLLTIAIPHGRPGNVILRGTIESHFFADNQILLVIRWCFSSVAVLVSSSQKSRNNCPDTRIYRQRERACMEQMRRRRRLGQRRGNLQHVRRIRWVHLRLFNPVLPSDVWVDALVHRTSRSYPKPPCGLFESSDESVRRTARTRRGSRQVILVDEIFQSLRIVRLHRRFERGGFALVPNDR